jgi:hypothetical protein
MPWEASGIIINITGSTSCVIASYASLTRQSTLEVDVQVVLPLVDQPALGRPSVRTEALCAYLSPRVSNVPDLEFYDFGLDGTFEGPPDH